MSRLYGREDEMSRLIALLASHRFVTLVGAGGIGKTRLAQTAALSLCDRFDDGVWMAELSSVNDAVLVPNVVAQALGIALSGNIAALQELTDTLRCKKLLLVLDNCEHLTETVSLLAQAILTRAPEVALLATSQEPLHLADEQQFRLHPLAVPLDAQSAGAREFGAIALFEARVRALDPRFETNDRNLNAVIEICRRLDGVPLAIELAVARVPVLGVDGVRARVDDRFRVLTAGARFALQRHQTLRAAIEWSVSLLSVNEAAVVRRLGVFVGSFDLDCAQRVAADETISDWAVLDHLAALVDKSLVVVEQTVEPRYRLLETTRAFALERLHEAGETDATLRRHAHAVLAVFERSFEERREPDVNIWLERYLPDLNNLRAALDWSAGVDGDAELQIALTGAATWIWILTSQRSEGLHRANQAIARISPTTPPALEARLHSTWLSLAEPRAGAPELAAGKRAIELYRMLRDRLNLFVALSQHARLLAFNRDFVAAERALQEAASLHDMAWQPALRSPMLRARISLRWMQGRFEDAYALAEEWFQLATSSGSNRLIKNALFSLEQAACCLGRFDEAIDRGRDLLTWIRRERFRTGEATALGNLSVALMSDGQLDEALAIAREALPLLQQSDRLLIYLDDFALLAFKRGRIAEAAQVLGRAEAEYAMVTNEREPLEQRARDTLLVLLQKALTPEELDRLMKKGASLNNDQAAHIALG